MKNEKLKIIFMGTPEFGAVILEELAKQLLAFSYQLSAVITALDKPVGRRQILTPSPVKTVAQRYNIPVFQPEKLKAISYKLKAIGPDLIVVAAYGQILPKEILEIPKYGCLNVHPSLLPKYRGASPIQHAILNGEKETGITIILMDEQIDHGPILAQRKTVIGPNETAKQLHDRLAILGSELLIDTIPDWINNRIQLQPQDEEKATYAKILTKEDGKIDWKKPAEEIEQQIRAFDPWPGTYTIYNGKILKILKAEASEDKLIIKEVQLEGKKPMGYAEFLRGHPGFILK